MDVSSYRKKYDELRERKQQHETQRMSSLGLSEAAFSEESAGVAFAAGTFAQAGSEVIDEAMGVVRNHDEDAELRAVTLHSIAIDIGNREDLIHMVLGLLRDSQEPTVLRLEALRILETLNFSSAIFNTVRPEYMAVLRELINVEDLTLRQRVIEILAQEKDGHVQKRLVEGLEDPSKALLPPEKAIQLLSYDIHAEYFPILREMVKKPPSAAAKREAIRALSADPASKDLLADLLNDKKQSQEVRRISALSLQSLSPEAFEPHARRIVLDEAENSDLRATAMTGLTYSRGQAASSQDTELTQQVERLQEHSSSNEIQRSAAQYISKQNEPSEQPSGPED
jgi:hypothetical protein